MLTQITDPAEQQRWDAVARVQRALLDTDVATLREILTSWHDWPTDAGVQRWVERMRRQCGLAADAVGTAAHG